MGIDGPPLRSEVFELSRHICIGRLVNHNQVGADQIDMGRTRFLEGAGPYFPNDHRLAIADGFDQGRESGANHGVAMTIKYTVAS